MNPQPGRNVRPLSSVATCEYSIAVELIQEEKE
jgi:hypothetical protein